MQVAMITYEPHTNDNGTGFLFSKSDPADVFLSPIKFI